MVLSYVKKHLKIMKIFISVFFLICSFGLSQKVSAQEKCAGADVYSTKNCSGDDSTKDETELFRLINEYRKQNNLPEVRESKSLYLVANRHLIDLNFNLKKLTHSWNDCEFDSGDAKTWKCIYDAPKKFDPAFSGIGYENVYYNSKGKFSPAEALEGWKKSPLHNAALLNQDIFKDSKWLAGGVAIDGKYAAVWFISPNAASTAKKIESKGLGVSFQDTVKNLTSVLSINNISSTIDSEKWVGTSADKSVLLEIFGKPEKVTEGKMGIKVRLDKSSIISDTNRKILGIFLENVSPDWISREKWLDEALPKLTANPKSPVFATRSNLVYELSVDASNFLNLNVKPKPKPSAIEY